jgi:CheY-like chemotaxis protein
MSSPRILIVEPPQAVTAELSGIGADLARAGLSAERATDLSQAIARLTSDGTPPPELVVLVEARPGIWTERELQALRAAAPLVRVLRVSGSWCDGQNRTGRPPAGSPGIAWHQAAVRLPRELNAATCGVLAAPVTATSEDLLLAGSRQNASRSERERIAIHAPRTAQAEAWAALCRGFGYRPQIVATRAEHDAAAAESPVDGSTARENTVDENPVDAVLWDCDPRDLADQSRVRDFVARAGAVPVVAVCGFPRPDDVDAALRHGVSAVLGKPLLAADFEWLFSRLFGTRGEQ